MTAIRRMQVLEQRAGKILQNRGYKPVIVSNFIRSSRYIAFNLNASRKREDGSIDTLLVKLKVSLHPMTSLTEAAIFCQDEIRSVKKFFDRMPVKERPSKFEVWLAIPLDGFQQFEITCDGIRKICEVN